MATISELLKEITGISPEAAKEVKNKKKAEIQAKLDSLKAEDLTSNQSENNDSEEKTTEINESQLAQFSRMALQMSWRKIDLIQFAKEIHEDVEVILASNRNQIAFNFNGVRLPEEGHFTVK
jgi:hypothetical protein